MVDFDTLEAGRETNDLVAVRVMGWHPVWVRSRKGSYGGSFIGGHYESELACLADCGDEYGPLMLWADERESTFGKHEHNWNPSADIKAAWEVVEHMTADYFVVVNGKDDSPEHLRWPEPWHCSVTPRGRYCDEDEIIHGYGDTAQLAICRTAPKAIQNTSQSGAGRGDSNETEAGSSPLSL